MIYSLSSWIYRGGWYGCILSMGFYRDLSHRSTAHLPCRKVLSGSMIAFLEIHEYILHVPKNINSKTIKKSINSFQALSMVDCRM